MNRKGEVGFEPTFAKLKGLADDLLSARTQALYEIWTHELKVKSLKWDPGPTVQNLL